MTDPAQAQTSEKNLIYKRQGEIAELHLMAKPLFMAADIDEKEKLMYNLEAVAADPSIKVLIIFNYTAKTGIQEYLDFHKRLLDSSTDKFFLVKMLYAFDQFILRIMTMPQIVIHADCGQILTQFLCTSLACDYRIISEDSWYLRGYTRVGMIPKGGAIFFLYRLLGRAKANELLMSSSNELPAENALSLGLVNKVVPMEKLETAAREMAQRFAQMPGYFLQSMKRLMNQEIDDLKRHLEMENQEILRIRGLPEFMERLRKL